MHNARPPRAAAVASPYVRGTCAAESLENTHFRVSRKNTRPPPPPRPNPHPRPFCRYLHLSEGQRERRTGEGERKKGTDGLEGEGEGEGWRVSRREGGEEGGGEKER